jgi:hypothetical protein
MSNVACEDGEVLRAHQGKQLIRKITYTVKRKE